MVSEEIFLKAISDLKDDIRRQFDEVQKKMFEEIKTIRKEVNEIRNGLHEQERSTQFISDCYEEMKQTNKMLLAKVNALEKSDSKQICATLEQKLLLEAQERKQLEENIHMTINPLELERRASNLELCGLEEKTGENVLQKVNDIISKISPGDAGIEEAFRIGPKTNRDGSVKKKRSILIRFKSANYRNNALENKTNLKKLNSEHGTLFLNENLPLNLKVLLGKANNLRKERGYKFLWTKNGTILVRKLDNTPAIAIKKISDLDKIV